MQGVLREAADALGKVKGAITGTSKLDEATSDRDDVTPPYLLEECAESLRSPAEVAQARDYLVARLRDRSPVVKFKTLRVIKHLCVRSMDFRRSMQRHADGVREHVSWTGPPDPYKGDIPNQLRSGSLRLAPPFWRANPFVLVCPPLSRRVRAMAKETIESLYSAAPAQPAQAQVLSSTGRMQGFGSSSMSTSSGPSGFGSAPASRGSASAGPEEPMGLVAAWGQDALKATGISDLIGAIKGQPPSAPQQAPLRTGGPASSGPGPRAPGQGGSAPMLSVSSDGYSAPSSAALHSGPAPVSEEALVHNLVAGVGVRVLPDAEELRTFARQAEGARGGRLAALLQSHVDQASSDPKGAARALAAFQALLQAGSSHGCYAAVSEHLHNNLGFLVAAAEQANPQIRSGAHHLLKVLGYAAEDASPAGSAATGVPAAGGPTSAPQEPLMDLLSLTPEKPTTGVSTTAPAPAAGSSLLDDMHIAPTGAPAAVAGDLLSGLHIQDNPGKPSAAEAAPAAQIADPFAGLNVAQQPPARPANRQQPRYLGTLGAQQKGNDPFSFVGEAFLKK